MWMIPSFSAARRDRSRPLTRHERTAVVDLERFLLDFPFCGFVTLTTEPIGNALGRCRQSPWIEYLTAGGFTPGQARAIP